MDFIVKYFKLSLTKYISNWRFYNTITTNQHAFNKYYLKIDSITIYGAALLLTPYQQKVYNNNNNNLLLNVRFGSLLSPRGLLLMYIWGENSI